MVINSPFPSISLLDSIIYHFPDAIYFQNKTFTVYNILFLYEISYNKFRIIKLSVDTKLLKWPVIPKFKITMIVYLKFLLLFYYCFTSSLYLVYIVLFHVVSSTPRYYSICKEYIMLVCMLASHVNNSFFSQFTKKATIESAESCFFLPFFSCQWFFSFSSHLS